MTKYVTLSLTILISLLATALTTWSADTENPGLISEYYYFEKKDLPMSGPVPLAWFFLRSGIFWNQKNQLTLKDVEWPEWNLNQIPISLSPVAGANHSILIFDENKKQIDEIRLEGNFAPDLYLKKAITPPAFYQIKSIQLGGRIEQYSPIYNWYQRRRLSFCELPVSKNGQAIDLSKNNRLELCVNTALSFLSATELSAQKYVEIHIPAIKGKPNLLKLRSVEREISSSARKNKAIAVVSKAVDENFSVELGLSETEKLPKSADHASDWKNAEAVSEVIDKDNPKKLLHEEILSNGATLRIFGFYSDTIESRRIESPLLGNRKLHIETVEQSPKSEEPVRLTQSRVQNLKTGLQGWLRPWQVMSFANYNSLSSGRGDKDSFLSLPGLDLRYFQSEQKLSFQTSFEKSPINLSTK